MTERILSCPFPDTLNPLSGNSFKFNIQRLPSVEYFLQQVSLPTVSLGEATQFTNFVDVPIPGDRMTFDPLEISFMVDSKMKNYISIFNWIKGLGFPESHQQFTDFVNSSREGNVYSDATLQVLDQLGNEVSVIQFIDCVPTSLSALQFETSSDDVQYLVGRAVFRYTLYKFID